MMPVPSRRERRLRPKAGAASISAQKTGRLKVNAITSVRCISKSMERICCATGRSGVAGRIRLSATLRLQSPEGVSSIARKGSAAPCSSASIGFNKKNHQRASIAATRSDPRSRNRLWGLSGMRRRAGALHAVYPIPEHHHGVQHDQALPQIGVGKVEPGHAVLAEVKERDEAQNIDQLNDRAAHQEPGRLHFPCGWE